ncbi:MAG: hypothetical protein BroJett021_05830 [Chloroflexota bacterium]|jgi:hypothetical protein|nr:hypothetical protein [Caldilinea sp.]GIK71595.1 MAG: hypothetical protein BroJett021_05830 [Chloroflexota bacterium]
MDKLRRFWSTATAHNLGADPFRRKRIALPLLLLLSLCSVGTTILSGPEVNFTAGYFLVVAVAAYVLGSGWGAIAAVAMLAAQLWVYAVVWRVASSQLILTTLLNSGIIYAITIAMFVVVHDVNRLREENLRLRTLRQTMVTVNDIVFNRLQYFNVLLDLADAGVVPKPQQIETGRRALRDVTKKLRQLSALDQVTSYRAAGDIEAVLLEDES